MFVYSLRLYLCHAHHRVTGVGENRVMLGLRLSLPLGRLEEGKAQRVNL